MSSTAISQHRYRTGARAPNSPTHPWPSYPGAVCTRAGVKYASRGTKLAPVSTGVFTVTVKANMYGDGVGVKVGAVCIGVAFRVAILFFFYANVVRRVFCVDYFLCIRVYPLKNETNKILCEVRLLFFECV